MAILTFVPKDPNEVLDYQFDWSLVLAPEDTIVTSLWLVPAEITKDSDSTTDTVTTVWLSNGEIGSHTLTNRITTAGGRTFDQSVTINVQVR